MLAPFLARRSVVVAGRRFNAWALLQLWRLPFRSAGTTTDDFRRIASSAFAFRRNRFRSHEFFPIVHFRFELGSLLRSGVQARGNSLALSQFLDGRSSDRHPVDLLERFHGWAFVDDYVVDRAGLVDDGGLVDDRGVVHDDRARSHRLTEVTRAHEHKPIGRHDLGADYDTARRQRRPPDVTAALPEADPRRPPHG